LSLSSYGSADLSSPGSVAWGSSAGKSDPCCGRLLNAVGRPGLHQSGLTSSCFTDCPSPGPRRNGLTIYWALGPLVRSFTLPVDPGDICPPQGRLHKGKGRLGEGGLVGRIKNHSPTRSRVNSRPRRTSLTKILLFYWRMLPNNSKLQKRTTRKRSKKIRKNKLQLLFFANWVSHSTPLKKNSTTNSDASIGTIKARLMNQQNSQIMKSSGTSAASAPQAPRIL
jgi:hypothetical protein